MANRSKYHATYRALDDVWDQRDLSAYSYWTQHPWRVGVALVALVAALTVAGNSYSYLTQYPWRSAEGWLTHVSLVQLAQKPVLNIGQLVLCIRQVGNTCTQHGVVPARH